MRPEDGGNGGIPHFKERDFFGFLCGSLRIYMVYYPWCCEAHSTMRLRMFPDIQNLVGLYFTTVPPKDRALRIIRLMFLSSIGIRKNFHAQPTGSLYRQAAILIWASAGTWKDSFSCLHCRPANTKIHRSSFLHTARSLRSTWRQWFYCWYSQLQLSILGKLVDYISVRIDRYLSMP